MVHRCVTQISRRASRGVCGLLCFVVWLLSSGRGEAQSAAGHVELRGRVFLAGDTVSLGGALIEAIDRGVSAVARRDGTYRLSGLSVGRTTLRVRLIGLSSRTLVIEAADPGLHMHDIALSRLPQTLSEVRIAGRLRWVPPRFDDVYRRMSVANGTFFTREDLDQINPIDLFSVVSRVPSARVNDTSILFAKCVNHGAMIGESGKVQIYIDGMRMTRTFEKTEQLEVLSMVSPTAVQAIEVYTSTSRIPAEFLDDACAVIAIWTK